MPETTKTIKGGDKIPHKRSESEKLKDKVRKHVSDINDVISDDDIRNSKTDTEEELKEEVEKKEDELVATANDGDKNTGKKNITPWDVLDE
ncbi:MAG TPA: hypothetical protein VF487_02525 [Chitinophagaceae bacterium]